jgi:hypothetical protein
MPYKSSQPGESSPLADNMNSFVKEGGKRPSAAPAQIQPRAFFYPICSFFGETTEENDCFCNTL